MPPTSVESPSGFDVASAGEEMYRFVERAYPLGRSITGDGVRQTLKILAERIPLEVREVPTGTAVLDWTVPKEWNLQEAWIKGPEGEIVVDSRNHNLHVLGYSVPFRGRLSLEELQEHLFSLPEQPELIPYRTSYYREAWGFCLPHQLRETLPAGEFPNLEDVSTDIEFATSPAKLKKLIVRQYQCHTLQVCKILH